MNVSMPIAYKKLEKNYELELIGDITLSEDQREEILLKLADFLGSSAQTLVLDFEKVTFVNSDAFGFLFIIKENLFFRRYFNFSFRKAIYV